MSARALPVAARLSRQQLRFMAGVARGGREILDSADRKCAARLSPAFVTVEHGHVRLTLEGEAVLDARRKAGKR